MSDIVGSLLSEKAVCPNCICSGCRTWDSMDILSFLSILFLVAGAILSGIGYIIPRTYEFDSKLPAREMEAIEIKYHILSEALDLCIILGMALVVISGILMACSAIVMMCDEKQKIEERRPLRSEGARNYYTSPSASAPPETEASAPPSE